MDTSTTPATFEDPIIDDDNVRSALEDWRIPTKLGDVALAQLPMVTNRLRERGYPDTSLYRGVVLGELLTTAWEGIKPPGEEPDPPGQNWLPYVLVRERYKYGVNRITCARALGIGVRGIDRITKAACGMIAKELLATIQDPPLPPPSPSLSAVGHRFIRTKIHVRLSLCDSETSERFVEVEAVGQPLNQIGHSRYFLDYSAQKWSLELKSAERQGGGEVQFRKRIVSSNLIRWAIVFDPPLRPGQRAQYIMHQEVQTGCARTYEELDENVRSGNQTDMFNERAFRVTAPTDELSITYEFPPGYSVTIPRDGGFDVTYGGADAPEERTRLLQERAFSIVLDQARNVWSYHLVVHNALSGHKYAIHWIPPAAAVVEELRRRRAS